MRKTNPGELERGATSPLVNIILIKSFVAKLWLDMGLAGVRLSGGRRQHVIVFLYADGITLVLSRDEDFEWVG